MVEKFEFELSVLLKIDVALVASFRLCLGIGFKLQLLETFLYLGFKRSVRLINEML
jgi:hypothetical protein